MLKRVFTLCTRAILSPETLPYPFFFFFFSHWDFFLNTHFTLLKKSYFINLLNHTPNISFQKILLEKKNNVLIAFFIFYKK